MPGQGSAELTPLVSRTQYDETVCRALRLFVGRGKRFGSSAALEPVAGVSARLIEAARCEPDDAEHRSMPPACLLSLCAAIGPEFTTLVLFPAQQLAAWLPTADTAGSVREFGADTVDDAAKVNRLTSDDDLSRSDVVELRPVGLRMMARGARLAFA